MSKRHLSILLAVTLAVTTVTAESPKKAEQRAGASSEVVMHPQYAESIARMAFLWGYPMVNMMNRQTTLTQIPEPGRLFGALPAAPMNRVGMLSDYINPGQRSVACPNQDVVYGLGFMDLAREPVVLQVPDFGDRFWVYAIYDQRTDQVGHLGKPYASKPGFYLLAGPDYQSDTPEGFVDVLHSPTNVANIIPRVFMDDTDEDRRAIQPVINRISVYPLSEYTGEVKVVNWSKRSFVRRGGLRRRDKMGENRTRFSISSQPCWRTSRLNLAKKRCTVSFAPCWRSPSVTQRLSKCLWTPPPNWTGE